MHKLTSDKEGWETVRIEPKYTDHWTQVTLEYVKRPSDSQPRPWAVVHRKAAVVIAAFTEDRQLVLVRQERIPIRSTIWEFPAGQIDEPHEENPGIITQTALRELHEESGYELAPGGELIPHGVFFSSPGLTDEHAYLFVATKVHLSIHPAKQDDGEGILKAELFSVDSLKAMVRDGVINDANTLALFARMSASNVI